MPSTRCLQGKRYWVLADDIELQRDSDDSDMGGNEDKGRADETVQQSFLIATMEQGLSEPSAPSDPEWWRPVPT